MSIKNVFLLGIIISAGISGHSQQNNPRLTLEDIYQKGAYRTKGYGPIRWMKDNKGYTTLESNQEVEGKDIIRYDALSGNRTVEVNAKKLVSPVSKKVLHIDNYEWSDPQ